MNITIEIPDYDKKRGIQYNWIDNFELSVSINTNSVVIKANTEGLKSLANHLLNLAQKNVPKKTHLHFDEYSSLEDQSVELIICKIDDSAD